MVSKRFGGVVAAADVSMQVPPGRITGLIGPNGAGKTTVVNLITGMLPVTSGTIRFGERDITRAPAQEVARAGLARTFQNIRLLAEATVAANVLIGFHRHERCSTLASLLGLPAARRESAAMRARAQALLERFGMARYADHPAGGLAYGHQRRVEMMRALAAEPALLLLDEPVAGMNDVEAGELGAIFAGLAKGGMGVLLIEHNIRFVTSLCDHVYVLDSGKLIAEGRPEAIVANPAVIAAYLGS
ncbi:MAG: ABC transporter ATP-binding protein [Alphaproteobacteria bacterium]|nr:ABC transporter ATP-binding protein [Alphaproteobacteria bacterium]